MIIYTDYKGNILKQENNYTGRKRVVVTDNIPDGSFFAMGSDSLPMQLFVKVVVTTIVGFFIYNLLKIRLLYSRQAFIVIFIIFLIYMIIDHIIWETKGIRVVFLTDKGIFLKRGKKLKEEFIPYSDITGIDKFEKINRKIVNILLGGKANKYLFSQITIFSGKRLRITNDNFNDSVFDTFLLLLEKKFNNGDGA
ncbi:MAG: hypothetical protein ABIN35_08625 [candidate division WOR-3 bacterium]